MNYIRKLEIELPERQSAFLWGPRQTGKSTLVKELFPDSISIDLLDSNVRGPLLLEPGSLFERLRAHPEFHPNKPTLIDEIQAVPELLNEVHRLIEGEGLSFVMCASSTRKLVRGRANLLGGRAWRFNLHPLTYGEITSFDLLTALNRGITSYKLSVVGVSTLSLCIRRRLPKARSLCGRTNAKHSCLRAILRQYGIQPW